jgi:hypothetical protein
MYISIKFLEYSFEHSNIDSPGNLYMRHDLILINPMIYKREVYYVRPVTYISDFGFFTESTQTKSYYYLTDFKESVELRSEIARPDFAYIQFSIDNKYEYYYRVFMKAQTLVANIGGIIKGILVTFYILTYIFTENIYYIDLINFLLLQENNKKYGKNSNNP